MEKVIQQNTKENTKENMEIEIEQHLENAGKLGLSMKQLKKVTGLTKNKIKRIIYNSSLIYDCDPYLHGSSKKKITVYSFKEFGFGLSYIDRKKLLNKRNLKKDTIEEVITF